MREAPARMLLCACALAAACARRDSDASRYQGVVEYDERDLAFEVQGRLVEVAAVEGQALRPGDLIARLDDSLEQSTRDARAAEAQANRDQLSLLRSGARAEDVRAMEAQVRAARAGERLLDQNLARTRKLFEGHAVPAASVDDLEGQLGRATGERQALEQNLSALRRGARPQEIETALHRLAAAESAVTLEDERLLRHVLRADRAGEVLEVHLEVGEMAGVGVPVVTVADAEHPYIDVFVPEGDVGGIRVGAPARARVDSVAGDVEGSVERVSRVTEFTPRYLFSRGERTNLVVRVRVRLHDAKRALHAGLPTFVRIVETGALGGSPNPPATDSAGRSSAPSTRSPGAPP
jgi:multidrug resistance efflux pump